MLRAYLVPVAALTFTGLVGLLAFEHERAERHKQRAAAEILACNAGELESLLQAERAAAESSQQYYTRLLVNLAAERDRERAAATIAAAGARDAAAQAAAALAALNEVPIDAGSCLDTAIDDAVLRGLFGGADAD